MMSETIYEYMTVTARPTMALQHTIDDVNQYGREGWRVIHILERPNVNAMHVHGGHVKCDVIFILERARSQASIELEDDISRSAFQRSEGGSDEKERRFSYGD